MNTLQYKKPSLLSFKSQAVLCAAFFLIQISSASADTVETRVQSAAGTGELCGVFPDVCGDGGLATAARLNTPSEVVPAPSGNGYFIVDTAGHRIRKVDGSGVITTVAGDGTPCPDSTTACGDLGPATAAQLKNPEGIYMISDTEFYIADTGDNKIRYVDDSGNIKNVAGDGTPGFFEGGTPTTSKLNAPRDVVVRDPAAGPMLIADSSNERIRRVTGDPRSAAGSIGTVAGTGTTCATSLNDCGDGGASVTADLASPSSIVLLPGDGFVFVDNGIHRVRSVPTDGVGIISRVAGSLDVAGFSGDGGAATSAQLNAPRGISPTPGGAFLIADTNNHRIRRFTIGGEITTVLGAGSACPAATDSCGDGGIAANTLLASPRSAVERADGSFLAADTNDNRIRRTFQFTVTDPPLPPPDFYSLLEVGKTVGVEPTSQGVVLVRRPGEKKFQPISKQESLPNGTEVDVTKATGLISIRTPEEGVKVQQANVSGGRFIIKQRDAKQDGVADFVLSSPISSCPAVPKDPKADNLRLNVRGIHSATRQATFLKTRSQQSSNPEVRRLRVQTKGRRVRTRGKGAAGAVRGTRWITTDDCRKRIRGRRKQEQTRVTVTEGIVAVRDFVRRKTFLVRAGKTHIAYMRKPAQRK